MVRTEQVLQMVQVQAKVLHRLQCTGQAEKAADQAGLQVAEPVHLVLVHQVQVPEHPVVVQVHPVVVQEHQQVVVQQRQQAADINTSF